MTFPTIAEQLGRSYGSTDMGNVTQRRPGLHVNFDIGCTDNIHTIGFRDAAAGEEAHQRCLKAAEALANVGAKVISDKAFLTRVQAEFASYMQEQAA